jgi:peptidoglycan/xylan/chitin deacetylase (PgdA/CDA1 family)
MPAATDVLPYLPITDRPRITWPGGAHVALWVSPNIEYYEFQPPHSPYRDAWPRVPHPDVRGYAWRDYGNRVAFWRLLEVLDRYAIRATVSLNLAVLDHFPEIGAAMVARDWDYMSHGLYNTRFLFGMTPDEERALVDHNIESLRRHTGKQLKGFFGPHGSISPTTMETIAGAGLLYSVDWFVDDQPFPLRVSSGRLIGVPYSWEVNDGILMTAGMGVFEAEYFAQVCKDQFDVLYDEGRESGRVMCIALHPSVIGQPHRIGYLDDALRYITGHENVWLATADEIAEHYLAHVYADAVAASS